MKPEKQCSNCYYKFRVNVGENGQMLYACQYILITGRRRPCPPGPACTVFKEGSRKGEVIFH